MRPHEVSLRSQGTKGFLLKPSIEVSDYLQNKAAFDTLRSKFSLPIRFPSVVCTTLSTAGFSRMHPNLTAQSIRVPLAGKDTRKEVLRL